MEERLEGMTAEEFLTGLGQETKVVTLANKLRVEIRRVDVMSALHSASVPVYGQPETKDQGHNPAAMVKARENLSQLVFASCVSPKFVPGTGVDKEKNEIGIDHPSISSGIKAELIANVLDFNGFSGPAAQFFRLFRGEELGPVGPGRAPLQKVSPRTPSRKSLAVRSRRGGGKKGR